MCFIDFDEIEEFPTAKKLHRRSTERLIDVKPRSRRRKLHGGPVVILTSYVFTADWLAQLVEHRATVREVVSLKPWPDQHSGSLNN